ncbi:MAG: hypothetical protein KC731_04550, partial [Myxococcales bacterium]|nr:hypothetical protein [Myxococcales bacterium]
MNLRSIFVSLPLALLLLAPACSPSTDAPRQGDDATAPVRRQKIGKADLWGSCEANGQSLCGGKSAGNCWCDAACEGFGDCCA